MRFYYILQQLQWNLESQKSLIYYKTYIGKNTETQSLCMRRIQETTESSSKVSFTSMVETSLEYT